MTLQRHTLSHKYLLIGLATILACACTVKTLYNQLDWLIADYLEDYVELSSEQQTVLYAHLDDTLLWHKTSQLPVYADWLQDFKGDVQSGLTYQQVEQNITNFQSYIRILLARVAEEMTQLLPRLTGAQRKELYATMRDKNAEFANKFIDISREEQIALYIERMEERFDNWLGSTTEQQSQLIKASAVKFQAIAPEALQTRRRWQAELTDIIETHKDNVSTGKAMHELFVNSERLRSDRYRQMFHDNQQVLIQLVIDVANVMTREQTQFFYSRIDNYSRNFIELAETARTKRAN